MTKYAIGEWVEGTTNLSRSRVQDPVSDPDWAGQVGIEVRKVLEDKTSAGIPEGRKMYLDPETVVRIDDEDPVNHPSHYTNHPSGVECIQITEHMSFTLGNAIKYIWRADLKNDAIEDLKKARFYLDREIAKREAE